MPTIKEIARACNVSVATISNVINNKGKVSPEKEKQIRKVIREMNYSPNAVAKNLKAQSTRTIGIIAEDMTVFALPDIIDGITEYCEKENYQILLVNLRLYKKYTDAYYHEDVHKEAVQEAYRKLLSEQVEGIIYVASHERKIDVLPASPQVPMIVAYGYTDKKSIPSVIVKDTGGAEKMTEYLIACGHKEIGLIAGKKDSYHTQARLEGYQKALFEHKILFDPKMVVYGDWERESGYESAEQLLKQGVTAIFAMNDYMAGGVYDLLQEKGLVPGKDIAVAGFDNREMASFIRPQLTTMGLPLHDIGYTASEVMLHLLKKEPVQKDGIYRIECEPFFRDSVNKR